MYFYLCDSADGLACLHGVEPVDPAGPRVGERVHQQDRHVRRSSKVIRRCLTKNQQFKLNFDCRMVKYQAGDKMVFEPWTA